MNAELIAHRIKTAWPRYDVVTAEELAACDLGQRLIAAAVRAGILLRLRRGAYVRVLYWQKAGHTARDLMRLRAHFLTTPHAGIYSHTTAARIHQLSSWDVPPTIHLSQPFASTGASSGPDTKTHHLVIPPEHVVCSTGPRGQQYRLTDLELTVLDCARMLDTQRAVIIGDHALRLGADLEQIRAMADGLPGARGIARARRALDLLDGTSESPGESRTRLLLSGFGIPMPEAQLSIRTRLGNYRADFAWRDIMLILEFDGRGKYFDYRPTAEVILLERQRESALTEEHWNFLRIGWADLDNPAQLKSRVLQAMDRAAVRTRALGHRG